MAKILEFKIIIDSFFIMKQGYNNKYILGKKMLIGDKSSLSMSF